MILELVLDPTKRGEHDFTGGKLAVIDPEKWLSTRQT
jgi:hypothetical protein